MRGVIYLKFCQATRRLMGVKQLAQNAPVESGGARVWTPAAGLYKAFAFPTQHSVIRKNCLLLGRAEPLG